MLRAHRGRKAIPASAWGICVAAAQLHVEEGVDKEHAPSLRSGMDASELPKLENPWRSSIPGEEEAVAKKYTECSYGYPGRLDHTCCVCGRGD